MKALKMKRILVSFLALSCVLCGWGVLSGEAADGVEKERGLVDWGQNYIESTGMAVAPTESTGAQAKALARRGAIVDLQRNLLEAVGGVQIDSRTTVNDFMAEDRVRSEVHGIIQGVELLDGKWDGESYTVTGRIRLAQLRVIVDYCRGLGR
ncbi:MAG: hypothetical protein LBQ42_05425 [Synergistaceae bacterium]|jgi:hypothetical protein|nr:hypothetical protein [Synergistaceae bacterium]